ncbi:nitropropane dioxygenase [Renibacterium salmoninarum ATCC 33209]|uniref:Propionate 3-nitronate monooxygenase n=1 Tax=Renibacterium salmoninarum (strain ATCC 33209 / DSM 20767 / JCM 11484 / NBRC 15589 / NCIMB 2235) TaxID=288705 RepID=A9WPB8_RENSM|nr:nitronate monooxygenase [Renibacterium salmoninarum]ABY22875.1 nitropropane dioxygenase [Renibacterium salmoninarum ATCC 33209]
MRSRGTTTGATVTSAEEAQAAVECGVDFLVVQHPNAGGHSGAFLDLARFDREQPTGSGSMAELLGSISQASKLPMVAAGGLGSKAAVADALQNGAVSAQLGTAFLCADEAGTKPVHRAALIGQEFTNTVRTRVFSGRWVRGLENRFMRDHADAPEGYPQIHHLTSALRAAAAAAGDPQEVNLWAGTEFSSVQSGSTASILARLLD